MLGSPLKASYSPAPYGSVSAATRAAERADFMRKVYAYMAGGLGLTALTAFLVAHSQAALELIVLNRAVFYGLLFAELGMVFFFSSMVRRMSASSAATLFFCYAILNGLTLSVIFLVYTQASITSTFVVAAGTFGAMSLFGAVTKRDLTGVGNFMIMGLFGLIIASIFNVFMRSETIYWLTTFMGVLVFTGLTAYDTQKIKELSDGNFDSQETHKSAIHGALVLYLDFVNLFLYLLRLLGRRR